MNPIITALSAMGKSSCTEIAARLKRDVRETLKDLEEMRDRGLVSFVNGYWSVTAAPAPEKLAPAATVVRVKSKTKPAHAPEPNELRSEILTLLKASGRAMATGEIAEQISQRSSSIYSPLGKLAAEGVIVKHLVKRVSYWAMPDATLVTDPAASAEPAEPAKTTPEIVADIPAFTSRAADLIVPTADGINRELRRARARVASLEKLRDTARIFRRQAKLLQEMQL
ncbi:hypothetical protein ACU6XY_09655 [Klebsiella aerogenes]